MDRLPITDASHIAAARRFASALAARAGFGGTDAGRVAIVTTELGGNILRHGSGGELLIAPDISRDRGIELLALDRGQGMADVAACLRDGYSTAGTPGTGLGAVRRLADEMAILSSPGGGTAIVTRFHPRGEAEPGRRDHAVIAVAKSGEAVCGDAAALVPSPDGRLAVMIADGLGHGPLAAAASREAVRLFQKSWPGPPVEILPILHAGLRATRGAAIATAAIDPSTQSVVYGGIGNISGFVTDGRGVRRMVSHAGTAGQNARRIQEFSYPFSVPATIVMFSDGLTSSWSPEAHKGLFQLDPLLIAGVLYRDHARGRDDTTVLVWKG
jgi:anti-sigma regulatory factor (Ser/Thr protein kinase)